MMQNSYQEKPDPYADLPQEARVLAWVLSTIAFVLALLVADWLL